MQRSRSLSFLALLVVVGVIVSSWAASATAAPRFALQGEGEPTFDLASLAIYPMDTGDDAYSLVDARSCLTPAACANPIFFGAETEESLTNAGLQRAYAIALIKRDADNKLERSLATTIAEYDNRDGAETGLETFLSWLSDPAAEVQDAAQVGDDSQLFNMADGLTSDDSTGVVGLRFRLDSLVVGVEVRDYAGQTVEPGDVESLANDIAKRIESIDESTLGSLALHHRALSTEYYVHLDGTTVPLSGESADAFSARANEFSTAGVDNVFLSNQVLLAGNDPNNPQVVMYITLYELPSASDASSYLFDVSNAFATQRERSGAYTDEPENPPAVGDESVWFLNVFSDAYQVMGFVRSGPIVARVIWQKNQAVNAGEELDILQTAETDLLPGATYSAQEQVKCIVNGGCPGVTRLSSRLLP